jgi:hypothetical protein
MIYLKEATLQDKKKVYEWFYHSDFSPVLNKMQGYPPESPLTLLNLRKIMETSFL